MKIIENIIEMTNKFLFGLLEGFLLKVFLLEVSS
jgi:hypothetical protein